MPTKISERDICRKVVERNSDVLVGLRSRGKSFMPYSKAAFRTDMRSGGFIATTPVIDAKWDMVKADEIVAVNGTQCAVDIPRLYLCAGLRVPMPTSDVRDRESERDTGEESE